MINDYSYVALTNEGKRIKGVLEAPNKKLLSEYLSNKSLTLLEVKQYKNLFTQMSKITIGKTIKEEELIFFLKQLSSMLSSKMRTVDALEVIASQTQQKIVRRIMFDVYYEVAAGNSVSNAMMKYPKDFPLLLVNMIRNGERSGDLITTIDNIANYYEGNREIKSEIMGAISTPLVYIAMAIGVAVMVVTIVLPNYIGLFESTNVDMPAITQMLLDISYFFQDYWMYLLSGGIIFGIVFYLIFYKTPRGKLLLGQLLIRFPVFGKIVVMLNLSVIASTLSQMVANHVNLIEAVHAANSINKNGVYK